MIHFFTDSHSAVQRSHQCLGRWVASRESTLMFRPILHDKRTEQTNNHR
ncbi:hypothetical protein V3C99_017930 [Haemonchus contortus]